MIEKNRISSFKSLFSGEGETISFLTRKGFVSTLLPDKQSKNRRNSIPISRLKFHSRGPRLPSSWQSKILRAFYYKYKVKRHN